MSRATNQLIAQGLVQGIENFAQGYAKQQEAKQTQSVLNDPNSTPIQKALAASKINPQLGAQIYKQSALKEAEQRIANNYPELFQGGQQFTQPTTQPPSRQPTQPTANIPGIGTNAPPETQMVQPEVMPEAQPQPTAEQDLAKADQLRNAARDYARINPAISTRLSEEANAVENRVFKTQKLKDDAFRSERDFNEKKSADFQKTISGLRQSIPRKENALNLARQALESENLGMFSKDYLADLFHAPGFRSTSGAALNLAVKENLFSNLSRVSAKAQNMWLEKVMAGAFPAKGQTQEANLTVQEALEAELALDKAQTQVYDQLSQEDMKKQGFVGGDIDQRVFKALEPIEKDIRDRTSYRTRVLYEKDKGDKSLEEMANKKAPTGTPLTRRMFQILLKKTGSPEKAIVQAKQLGYAIYPNEKVEEFSK